MVREEQLDKKGLEEQEILFERGEPGFVSLQGRERNKQKTRQILMPFPDTQETIRMIQESADHMASQGSIKDCVILMKSYSHHFAPGQPICNQHIQRADK